MDKLDFEAVLAYKIAQGFNFSDPESLQDFLIQLSEYERFMIFGRYIQAFDFDQDLLVFTKKKKFIFEVDLENQIEGKFNLVSKF